MTMIDFIIMDLVDVSLALNLFIGFISSLDMKRFTFKDLLFMSL